MINMRAAQYYAALLPNKLLGFIHKQVIDVYCPF